MTTLLPLILLLAGLVLGAAGVLVTGLGNGQPAEHVRVHGYHPRDQGLAPH